MQISAQKICMEVHFLGAEICKCQKFFVLLYIILCKNQESYHA